MNTLRASSHADKDFLRARWGAVESRAERGQMKDPHRMQKVSSVRLLPTAWWSLMYLVQVQVGFQTVVGLAEEPTAIFSDRRKLKR